MFSQTIWVAVLPMLLPYPSLSTTLRINSIGLLQHGSTTVLSLLLVRRMEVSTSNVQRTNCLKCVSAFSEIFMESCRSLYSVTYCKIEQKLTVHVKDGTHERNARWPRAMCQLNNEVCGHQQRCSFGFRRIDIQQAGSPAYRWKGRNETSDECISDC